ncbi:MAG: nucleotide sugar dehydrogenase, partial [Melioribacteraceae bacterium]|nr:nucleotide sugar dehydrogenase [Melioribacteraceae bacterium]
MNYKKELLGKIADKTIKVGIIGLGYVGLPLGLEFTSKGIEVLGFDLDQHKVNSINDGKSYIKHIDEERIISAVSNSKLKATDDFSLLP